MSGSGSNLIDLSTAKRSFYVPAFELRVQGAPLPRNVMRDVSEVTYDDGVERIDGFTLVVANWDAAKRQPKYIGLPPSRAGEANAKVLLPGNEIQLLMGYQGEMKLLMTGFITTLDVEYSDTGGSKVTVHGLNVLDRLRKQQFTWSWPDDGAPSVRDSDIARALEPPPDAKQGRPGLGIKVRVNDAARGREPALPYVIMNNQYPIVFLLERARRLGYEVTIDEEAGTQSAQPRRVLYFGPTSAAIPPTYILEWGRSLQSFRPVYSSARQLFAVTVCGWDRQAKKRIQERVTLDTLPADMRVNDDLVAVARAANREDVVTDQPVGTVAEAKRRAQSILREQHHTMVTVSGATVGLVDLRAGRNVIIRGTGAPFDGSYFVTATHHVINETGYRTTFEAKRIGPEKGAAS